MEQLTAGRLCWLPDAADKGASMRHDLGTRRAVVVTGCGQGIGLSIFERFVMTGMPLSALRSTRGLADALRLRFGPPHQVIVGDVADGDALERTAAAAAKTEGGLCGWVNSAGITRATNLHDVDRDTVERVFEVNLFGCYWGSAQAVQQFVRQRSGGSS